MVLWHGETNRHQGAMESEALWLMGVEPEWNPRGVVDRLRLVPDAELGRPRVDVVFTVSGLYRDGFADKILLLDRAAKLAASAGSNALSRQNAKTRDALVKAGMSEEQAAAYALARVFATAPGTYGFGLQQIVEQSKDFGNERGMTDLYVSRMNYAFTADAWGVQVPKLLEAQLAGNDAVLHSRSSNLYGVADNDDFYQYVGGLSLVSRSVNGTAPALFLNNLRAGGRERVEDVRTALATELTARNWNPKWLKEMQLAGYSGAREMMRSIEFLYGWQATAPEIVDGSMWQNTYDVYVADKHGLDMAKFFDEANPYAYQATLARLLEVDRQGRYQFSAAERATLIQEYVKSVNAHGASCSANTCGNVTLHQHIAAQAPLVAGLGNLDWSTFGSQLARSTQWSASQIPQASAAMRAGMAAARPRPAVAPQPAAQAPNLVSGFRMSEMQLDLGNMAPATAPGFLTAAFGLVWAFLLLGVVREILRATPQVM
jgi:cobaltochelatase CobN